MNQLHPKAVWMFFFNNLIFFFFISIMLFSFAVPILSAVIPPLFVIILLFIVWISLSFIFAKLSYKYWKYQLVETSIRIEKGVIWKKYVSIPYDRIQNVDIYRGILARLFGLSDVQIQTAGYSMPRRSGFGFGSEGRLPGLDISVAEQLRDELINKIKGSKQGL